MILCATIIGALWLTYIRFASHPATVPASPRTSSLPSTPSTSASYIQEARANLTRWQQQMFKTAHTNRNIRAPKLFDLYTPAINCPPNRALVSLGPAGIDGSKWICGTAHLTSPCVVFSLGSNGDYAFEADVLAQTGCTVHTFDCTISATKIHILDKTRHFFYPLCIGADNLRAKFVTLETARTLASAAYIDVLKIDIEGYELDVLGSLTSSTTMLPQQILVEIHMSKPSQVFELALFLQHFAALGYAMAHAEKNSRCPSCCEYVFVRIIV